MRIGFRWLEGEAEGTIDLFEVEDLTEHGPPRVIEHQILTSAGRHDVDAMCVLNPSPAGVVLDYETFAEINRSRDLAVGALRLGATLRPEPRITRVEWRDSDSSRFEAVAFETVTRPSRTSTAAAVGRRLTTSIGRALLMSQAELNALLPAGKDIPRRLEVAATVFDRNPFVVAATLRRASGVCEAEGCGRRGPFISRVTGEPYLEVHHITPLALGGSDSVDNTLALCPNCHRKQHHE